MNILFSTRHVPWPWLRQTPNGDGAWGSLKFSINEPEDEHRWLVVYDEPPAELQTRIPSERRILFVTEPPGIKTYPRNYISQFGTIVSPFELQGAQGRLILRQTGLPWHYGVDLHAKPDFSGAMNWSALAADKQKSREISVICSNMARLPQQRLRLAFVERLKQRLGPRVDWYGRGFVEIADKADAIGPYRYHVVLENNTIDHFWTEKLGDAWLGDAYAIFAGCHNAGSYFDRNAFAEIDIADPDAAITRIENVLASNAWEANLDAIRANKRALMNEHNVFAVIAGVIEEQTAAGAEAVDQLLRAEALKPSSDKWLRNRLKSVRRAIRRAVPILDRRGD